MKVVIVGAGIIGASCAYHLRELGAEVTVLDARGVGTGASADSFGWINANFAETEDYYVLRRAAIDSFRALSDRLGLPSVRWRGALWWEEEGEAFDAEVAAMRGRGYEVEIVDSDGFTNLEPNFATPPDRAVLGHVEGAANGDQIARAMLSASGATVVVNCTVNNVTTTRVETSHGPIEADRILVTTGAATEQLTGLPMANKSGVILHTHPVPRVIDHIIMSPGLYLRQDADGRLIMGGHFTGAGFEGHGVAELGPILLDRLHKTLPTVDATVEAVRFGRRPVPLDGLPAIGDWDGVYHAVMHSGITLAPHIGGLVAQEVMGTPSDVLNRYRPSRFLAVK